MSKRAWLLCTIEQCKKEQVCIVQYANETECQPSWQQRGACLPSRGCGGKCNRAIVDKLDKLDCWRAANQKSYQAGPQQGGAFF